MINIEYCKNTAKELAEKAMLKMGEAKLEGFDAKLDEFENEYKSKYMFSSNAINLQKLQSFNEWISSISDDKDAIIPILVDKMVNERDLYALSVYQTLNLDEYNLLIDAAELYELGGGENALALITGCHWIENQTGE